MRQRLAIVLGVLLVLPGLAHAWWNDQWSQRAQVTLDTTPAGVDTKTALTNVPVLVRLHSGNFSFLDAKPDGSDLRFVAPDDKTELKFHVEKWDAASELALVWVQVPALAQSSEANRIWVYWGNDEAKSAADPKGTYDSTFAAVYHFADAQDSPPQDSTANGYQASASTAGRAANALIGPGLSFDGKQEMIVPAGEHLRMLPAGSTVSLWVSPAALDGTLFQQEDGGRALSLALEKGVPVVRIAGGDAAPVEVRAPTALAAGSWNHIGFTIGEAVTLYVGGKAVGSVAVKATELGGQIHVGAGFSGLVDELQVSRTARSADWFALAAGGQGVESKLVAVVHEDEGGGGQHGYLGILIRNLTPDAWVVIVILMVMFAAAVGVMVGKSRMVGRIDRDNRRFLRHFRDAAGDFLNLDDGGSYAGSTLFRLHQAGIHELGKRINGTDGGVALSDASINAIKAAIDADMVRENHKLNAKMVLLTIAISGGPFLGLLGTVVGVMITFAAIAAAGDVNVNAIAPGIAAALLATVAGLAVAIPSLFGYNYLAMRIKNISADMQIFVDELVTRIAEVYSAQ